MRKIHWVKWERMLRPKEKGGLRFKSLLAINEVLIANGWGGIGRRKSIYGVK